MTPARTQMIGESVEGRPQMAHGNFDFAGEVPRGLTLILGGIHGDEMATVHLLEGFIERHLGSLNSAVAVLPIGNPDGYERRTRYNARGVDLNRNCGYKWKAGCEEPPGPQPWSEPESRALRDVILRWRPSKIISLHWALAEIESDGEQSEALAEAMWEVLKVSEQRVYRLRKSRESPGSEAECPGSFGQWCGYGLQYGDGSAPAMITLELPYNPELERPLELPAEHLEEMHLRWDREPEVYMRAVEGTVYKMLLAACGFPR